jgi:hypothetical protein
MRRWWGCSLGDFIHVVRLVGLMVHWFLVSISLLLSRRNVFDTLLADRIVVDKIVNRGFPSSLHPSLIQNIHISDDGRAGQDDPLYRFRVLRQHDMAPR